MKTKTAEEIIKEMIDAMPFRLSENIIPYIKEAMEIYRSQASDLPSDGEAKRIANNFFQWTENLNKGDSMYSELLYCNEHNLRLQDQINSYVASKDARIKELEEALLEAEKKLTLKALDLCLQMNNELGTLPKPNL